MVIGVDFVSLCHKKKKKKKNNNNNNKNPTLFYQSLKFGTQTETYNLKASTVWKLHSK